MIIAANVPVKSSHSSKKMPSESLHSDGVFCLVLCMDVVTSAWDVGQSAIATIRNGGRAAGRAAGVPRAWRRCDAARQAEEVV